MMPLPFLLFAFSPFLLLIISQFFGLSFIPAGSLSGPPLLLINFALLSPLFPLGLSHLILCWETVLARLRIGHTRFTHSYLMSRSPPPSARLVAFFPLFPIFLHVLPLQLLVLQPSPTFLPCLADVLAESPSFSLPALVSFLRATNALHLI